METEADYVEACIMLLSSDLPIENQHSLFEAMRTSMTFVTVGTKIEHAVSAWLDNVERYLKSRNNPCGISNASQMSINATFKRLGVGILNTQSLHRIEQNKHSLAHYVRFSYYLACNKGHVNKLKYAWTGSEDDLCAHIANIKFIDFDFDFQKFPPMRVPVNIHTITTCRDRDTLFRKISHIIRKNVRIKTQIGAGSYAEVYDAEVAGLPRVARVSFISDRDALIRAIRGDMMQHKLSKKQHCAPYVYHSVSLYCVMSRVYIHVTLMEKCPPIQFTVGDLVRYQSAMDCFISRLAKCFKFFNQLFGDRIVLMDRKIQNTVGVAEELKF